MTALRHLALLVALGLLAGGCGDSNSDASDASVTGPGTAVPATVSGSADSGPSAPPADASEERFPDVIAVDPQQAEDGTWRFSVTISSPYDTPQRYADAWRVLGPADEELGVRALTHDHANEQPFTRSLSGVEIPVEVTEVRVQGRDLLNGWGGASVVVSLAD